VLLALVLAVSPSVKIVTSIDGAKAQPGWAYARLGQKVLMHAQVDGGKAKTVRWSKLEPVVDSVDNTTPKFHFEPISYRATSIESCDDRLDCPADVTPSRLAVPPELAGTGNMAFQVKVTTESGDTLATPGLEARDVGGLAPSIHRVAIRRDDTYLGYLSELNGSPFIFGSAGPDGRNQTDRLLGADCADLAVYGRRRLGKGAQYTSTYHFDEQAPELVKATGLDGDGRATDKQGRVIVFGAKGVKPGDVLHFPGSRHVAVLFEDRPPLGVLDGNDVMLHTCWGPPKLEAIGSAECASLPWRVLRWKD
jgi:hypothetical protein